MTDIYRMFDSQKDAPELISINDAKQWNEKGYGIFWTINEFGKKKRRIENLIKIVCWAIDIDSGSKPHMIYKINRGLYPSLIVESKRGFHIYWQAIDGTKENWNDVMIERLVPFYGADTNARDMARLLRVPGYFHLKDPKDPFLIKEVYRSNARYTQKQMLEFYKLDEKTKEQKSEFAQIKRQFKIYGNDFWDKVWNLDCEFALSVLSGHDIVNNERFSFKRTSRGNKNIHVNNKSTSTWIDKFGRIGSLSKGGPTIAQYLKWYGHPWEYVIKTLKETFEELNGKN